MIIFWSVLLVTFRRIAAVFNTARQLLPWGLLNPPPVRESPKPNHKQLIRWFTSGFE